MALGEVRNISSVVKGFPSGRGVFQNLDVVRPGQIVCAWLDVIDAGGLERLDAAAIDNPDLDLTGSATHIFRTNGFGTQLKLRMKYDDGITPSAHPVVQCFGRVSGDPPDAWQLMPNRAGETSIELTTAASTDLTDGTWKYTAVDPEDHHIDQDGCNEFVFGVTVIFAGTGDPTASTLQVAVI